MMSDPVFREAEADGPKGERVDVDVLPTAFGQSACQEIVTLVSNREMDISCPP